MNNKFKLSLVVILAILGMSSCNMEEKLMDPVPNVEQKVVEVDDADSNSKKVGDEAPGTTANSSADRYYFSFWSFSSVYEKTVNVPSENADGMSIYVKNDGTTQISVEDLYGNLVLVTPGQKKFIYYVNNPGSYVPVKIYGSYGRNKGYVSPSRMYYW